MDYQETKERLEQLYGDAVISDEGMVTIANWYVTSGASEKDNPNFYPILCAMAAIYIYGVNDQ